MNVLMTTTLILGSVCFFEAQAVKGTSSATVSPFFHLARGEHFSIRGKFHGETPHSDSEPEKHIHLGDSHSASNHSTEKNNHPPIMDRLHTLHEKRFMNGGDFGGHATIKGNSGGVHITVQGEYHSKVVRGGDRPGGNHTENNHQGSSGNQGDNHNSDSSGSQTTSIGSSDKQTESNNTGSPGSQTASTNSSGKQTQSFNTGSTSNQGASHDRALSTNHNATSDLSLDKMNRRIHTLNNQENTSNNSQNAHWNPYGGWGTTGAGALICYTDSDGSTTCY